MTPIFGNSSLRAFLLSCAFAAALASAAASDLLFEDFTSGLGEATLVTGGNWVDMGGDDDPIFIGFGSLSHPDIPGTSGGSLLVAGGTGPRQDIARAFPQQGVAGAGDVETYVSFLVRVDGFPGGSGTEDFFLALMDGPSSGVEFGQVFIRNNAGNPEYGVSWDSPAGNYTGSVTTTAGAVDFIVMRVTSAAGAAPNDHVALWVNPPVGGPEGPPDLSVTSSSSEITEGLGRVEVLQRTSSIVGRVDLIRVGTTWGQVTSAALPVELSEFSID